MLANILVTDDDFTAFCLDYFPKIQHRFSAQMDRISKTNLLLEIAKPKDIIEYLQRQCPEIIQLFSGEIATIMGDPRDKERRQTEEDLVAAFAHRESLIVAHADTSEVDKKILSLRRQQRKGPLLTEGELLLGRYKLLEVAGRGGFSEVWQAFDRRTQKIVAVKVLHPQWIHDQSFKERFERGARRMADLSHPNIARVLSEPTIDDGFLFFTMDYLGGGDLGRALVFHKYSTQQMMQNIFQVGSALEYAHKKGLIHRDVKPQNILLDPQGVARLADFDLVGGLMTTGGTRTGGLGTFVYSAPEQMEDASRVDLRADIYSLGMVTLSILCGRILPIRVIRELDQFIESTSGNEPIKKVIRRATAWEVHARYGSVNEFCQELSNALESTSAAISAEGQDILTKNGRIESNWSYSTTGDTLELVRGVWRTENNSTYCINYVDGGLRCAYCFGGDRELTGHIFDYKVHDDQLFGRFRWIFSTGIQGYHYLRLVMASSMMGGWFYADETDTGQGDVVSVIKSTLRSKSIYPMTAHRIAGVSEFPSWAMEYFNNRSWLNSSRFERETSRWPAYQD